MKYFFSSIFIWGILGLTVLPKSVYSQDMPLILSSKTLPIETGVKLEFLVSSFIKKEDVSSWIEQDNWFILNFYNIIRPETGFFKNLITYPIRKVEQSWIQNSNSLQLSIQINRSIGIFDVLIHDEGRKIDIVITYSDFVEAKELNPSFVFPDLKESKKKSHPLSWKDVRERTSLEIVCDTKGLPIYVDGQMVGISH